MTASSEHMHRTAPIIWFVALCTTGLQNTAFAQNKQDARWIHGSWVNIRTTAASDAPIATHLTTNTAVTLKAQNDKTCEIAWGDGQRGFMPCKLLGDRLLTLAELTTVSINDKPNPQYAPARAFWIAPSMASLFLAGKHFQLSLLSAEQYKLESDGSTDQGQPPPRLVRYPVPEFEAMKAVLTKGLVASPDMDPPLLSCKQLQAAAEKKAPKQTIPDKTSVWEGWNYPNIENYPHADGPVSDCRAVGRPDLQLPAIKPSLFKSSREIAPGSASVEHIGAHFGIVERGRVLGGPKWVLDYDHMRYTGAWDIGNYQLTLDKPVVEHVIGRTGLVGAYQWTPQITVVPYGASGSCDGGLRNKRKGKQLVANYPNIKDELMWFQAPAALPFKTAKITTRKLPAPATAQTPDNAEVKRVVVYEIDLDRDGVPDFVQWDIWVESAIDGPNYPILASRQVFVNINGEWYPFDQDSFAECS